jgi:hypothetical protein
LEFRDGIIDGTADGNSGKVDGTADGNIND